jgi:hypothetical protein
LTNIDHYMTDHIAVKYDGESSEIASTNEKAAA